MTEFPSDIKFKFPWRGYQERVLKELDYHLGDNKLHVIAPPGSGKTVLGLEVAKRLNQPVLILSPTLAVKDQWIQRFCELFLQTNVRPDWISDDIKRPEFFTVSTYQSLISLDERDLQKLKNKNIKTILADEAHHLRNEWWRKLTDLCDYLNPTVVGLTATPPYDVSYSEWKRYSDFNGPVDAEISVPELVQSGELCPHQDLVMLSLPTDQELATIYTFRKGSHSIYQKIKNDDYFKQIAQDHPFFQNPNEYLESIYSSPQNYASLLVFLNEAGIEIPESHKEIIGNSGVEIPKLDEFWFQILLEFFIQSQQQYFTPFQEYFHQLKKELRKFGLLKNNKVRFSKSREIRNRLIKSINKLGSIDKIVEIEHAALNTDLRLVILTDYIRKEIVQQQGTLIDSIGVAPIFEFLRRKNPRYKMGILTGSLIVLPKESAEILKNIIPDRLLKDLKTKPFQIDNSYRKIEVSGNLSGRIIHYITDLFKMGGINVLVGTKSLLGEGWDAPFLNTLILATMVGSFVSSNQLRGRVIRTDPSNPSKTGNIWHLSTIDPTVKNGGYDVKLLERRFDSFLGLSLNTQDSIESGLDRLNIPEGLINVKKIETFNNRSVGLALNRNVTSERWMQAIKSGDQLVKEVKIPFPSNKEHSKLKSLHLTRTIGYSFGAFLTAFTGFFFDNFWSLLQALATSNTKSHLYDWVLISTIILFCVFGVGLFKHLRAFIKYRDISKDIRNISIALLKTLLELKIINSPVSKNDIEVEMLSDGSVICHLEGCSDSEKNTFIDMLTEIVNPIKNPRYIVIRKFAFWKLYTQRDYHAVPEFLSKNKTRASLFSRNWDKFVGNNKLVFIRNYEGRKLLLKARFNSLSSEFENVPKTIRRWT